MGKNIDDQYWLGLEQLNKDPEFLKNMENEFMSSPLKEEGEASRIDRRNFMKLMGASVALTSAGCLERPVQKIIPYNNRPAEIVPGVANYYTSSYFDGMQGVGLLVRTREGRPLFLSRNPEYPTMAGLSPRISGSLLNLYDPDRLRMPVRNLNNPERTNRETVEQSLEDIDKKIIEGLKSGGVRVLTGHMPSPSTRALLNDFRNAYGAKHVVWSPYSVESVSQGQRASYGDAVVPRYRFDKAYMVVSIDCDFLSTYLSPGEFAAGFSKLRDPDAEKMSRFVAFESQTTLTGMNSDDRYRIKPSQQVTVAMAIAHELIAKMKVSALANVSAVKSAVEPYANAASELGIDQEVISKLAKELWDHKGESLVISGGLGTERGNATHLQIAVNLLNSILGNDGKTVDYSVAPFQGLDSSFTDLEQLIKDMKAGRVNVLIMDGDVNPGLQLPESMGFREALSKVKTVVSTSNYIDETGGLADYVVPAGHAMENWNDWEFQKDLMLIQQPTIRPMFKTRSMQDSLMAWMKGAKRGGSRVSNAETFHDYLKARWTATLSSNRANLEGRDAEDRWVSLLHKGFYAKNSNRDRTSSGRRFRTESLRQIKKPKAQGMELVLYTTAAIGYGEASNNAWLQELPDPVTKICWDNYVNVSPKFAEANKLSTGDVIHIMVGENKAEAAVNVLPGMHDEVMSIALGYGRGVRSLKVGHGVGFAAHKLLQAVPGLGVLTAGIQASFAKTSKTYELANVQGHHGMEGRQIVVEAPLDLYKKDKNAGIHRHKFTEDIWTPHEYNGHAWGMSVDLNTCIGCSACTVACQSENNIPVVGKKYILRGREMSWIRIDRYWKGSPDQPDTVMQPIMCQHCENAPCERVCPVLATVHTDEGLNAMSYNRCVGTRYCSNNCPYKVRRFNWFNYIGHFKKPGDTTHMALNPDVTVRSRGVMEKCTFCVQRIKEAKNTAKDENRMLRDGDITTACQAVCPTNAIAFGDLNDKESEVSKKWTEERAYMLLEEQQTRARVRYLARIRNAHREVKGHHGGDDHHSQKHNEKAGEHS